MSVRGTTCQMLDTVARSDWPLVKRLSRKLSSMASPDHRRSEIERWLRLNGAEHPEVAAWIRDQAARRERSPAAAGRSSTDTMTTQCTG
jgi:anti-sigma factor RsiW